MVIRLRAKETTKSERKSQVEKSAALIQSVILPKVLKVEVFTPMLYKVVLAKIRPYLSMSKEAINLIG